MSVNCINSTKKNYHLIIQKLKNFLYLCIVGFYCPPKYVYGMVYHEEFHAVDACGGG